jgi:altronate hydrolase
MERPLVIRIQEEDNVAVALETLEAGREITLGDETFPLTTDVPAGHKFSLCPLAAGDEVVKYGFPIGHVTSDVGRGAWVHSHNLATGLSGLTHYHYRPSPGDGGPAADADVPVFQGYRRRNGQVGTRNEVWILNTVGCVNHAAERIARLGAERFGDALDGIHTFGHPYGCSQLGDDLANTQRVLAGLMRHPNAGGVLVLGLGCENNQLDELLRLAGDVDRERLQFFNSQDVGDEVDEGLAAVARLVERASTDRRVECPASDLVLGHKCGGSDGFSGISANPLVGRIADRLTGVGGTVLLTEVPEMFGAEQLLMNRCVNESVFRDLVAMVDDFKEYFLRHHQPIYENPSPGNRAGGLTTLEEKSLGAIQKGGQAPVAGVLRYGDAPADRGLVLLEAPGNDGVSSTAMVASGATVLLFTTGRGTPLGFPAPTLKISSNSSMATRKPHWIDFNAGGLLDGTATMDQLEAELFALVLAVASGTVRTNNERHGYREIAIWKEGVTL